MSDFEEAFPARLGELLDTAFLGRSVVAKEQLSSTNTTASELACASAPEGLLVVADSQTGGMGRNGRTWFSPPGRNLYFSMLLRPDCMPGVVPQLAIVVALSLHDAVCRLCPDSKPCVKWPNDLLCNGSKLSGILCTMSCTGADVDYAVVGIGINVNLDAKDIPAEINATSLKIMAGAEMEREAVLAAFLNVFESDYQSWLSEKSLKPFLGRWSECSCLDGQYVEVEQGRGVLGGTVEGITDEGHLRLRDAFGRISLAYAGDAHVRKR